MYIYNICIYTNVIKWVNMTSEKYLIARNIKTELNKYSPTLTPSIDKLC
jgi:hypothetical protein